jgi:hypothetical protein
MKAGCRANPVHLERGVPTLPAGRFGPVSQDGGDDERPPAGPRKTAYSNPRMILNGEISPLAGLLS